MINLKVIYFQQFFPICSRPPGFPPMPRVTFVPTAAKCQKKQKHPKGNESRCDQGQYEVPSGCTQEREQCERSDQ